MSDVQLKITKQKRKENRSQSEVKINPNDTDETSSRQVIISAYSINPRND